jgi:hypothetical protein
VPGSSLTCDEPSALQIILASTIVPQPIKVSDCWPGVRSPVILDVFTDIAAREVIGDNPRDVDVHSAK